MSVERIRNIGHLLDDDLRYKLSRIRRFAIQNKKKLTPAEKELFRILCELNGGVLKNKFVMQHPISGKWIVDFFFPTVRLAIEVDGSIHNTEQQIEKDCQKARDCGEIDITLIRVSNLEVFGIRRNLLEKLRAGWREALRRENKYIGKPYDRAKLPSTPR